MDNFVKALLDENHKLQKLFSTKFQYPTGGRFHFPSHVCMLEILHMVIWFTMVTILTEKRIGRKKSIWYISIIHRVRLWRSVYNLNIIICRRKYKHLCNDCNDHVTKSAIEDRARLWRGHILSGPEDDQEGKRYQLVGHISKDYWNMIPPL